MKILHVIQGLSIGGAEKLLVDTLPKYNEIYETHLIILKQPDENNIYYNLLRDKVTIHISPHKNIKSFKNIIYIRKILKREKFDIVHTHLLLDRYFTFFSTIMMIHKPKLVTTVHSIVNPEKEKKLSSFIYKRYNKIIAISEATRNSILKYASVKPEKTVTIYNGIDMKRFNPGKDRDKIKKELGIVGEIVLLMVGRFSEVKDQNTVIKALKLLPNKYKLVLVGDGELKDKSEGLAKKLNLEKRVYFLGLRSDIPEITKSSDIIIVSSKSEGFGLVAVEGMASKKPVIGTNVPGLDEVIQLNEMLFTVENYKELATLILSLEDGDLYEEISNKMFKLSEKFKIETMVNKHIKLYEKVIREKK